MKGVCVSIGGWTSAGGGSDDVSIPLVSSSSTQNNGLKRSIQQHF